MGRGLMILVAGMVIIFGIVQKGVQERQKMLPERTEYYYEEQQARNIASSLAEYAIREIEQNQEWSGGGTFNELLAGSGSISLYKRNDYISSPESLPINHSVSSWDQYTILIMAQAEYMDLQTATEVMLRKDSFSKYSYFTNFEPSNIYFIDGDNLSGPVHTNGTFKIAGRPTFNGYVSSPNDWEGHPFYTNDPQFNGGAHFNANTRPPPNPSNLELQNRAQSGGLSFNNVIRATFKVEGDIGKVDVSGQSDGSWSDPTEYNLDSFNGVISSTDNIYTEGTVKGAVTVHSAKDIIITGDLVYNTSPLADSTSTDLTGLVSERNVIIDKNAHEADGSQDIDIHASIMALDKSFTVEEYNSGSSRGELRLHGGIIQQERGPVGTFSGGSVASGFSKMYTYDKRLLNMVPPSFPRESVFSINYWKERPSKKVDQN